MLKTFRFPWELKKKKEKATSLPPIRAVYFTGSRHICNPPVMNTDDDRIVLVDELPCDEYMKEQGWELCGEEEYHTKQYSYWRAWRREEKNLIFTTDKDHYLQFVAVTLLARELNLTNKEDRVALFHSIAGPMNSTLSSPQYAGPLPDKGML